MAERRTSLWIPFVVGAVAMLVVILLVLAWRGREGAGAAADVAGKAVDALPDVRPPTMPGPHLPDVPIPRPK